ncbi:MAG: ACP S-malonyltransferase [Clostridiales bacterium]|nr:ACP S-malonyltransferase [Clostridiales bacterium]
MNKIAFIFPGQGSQYVGMGKDFCDNFNESRQVFNEASDLLGIDMKNLVFENEDKINLTEYTQIAMVTTCISMLRAVERLGIEVHATAGLSLGEYPALIKSKVITFEDGLKVVRERGLLMENALPKKTTTMAAVMGLDANEILGVCSEVDGLVTIANYNCPGQIVITGEIDAIEKASGKLKKAGARRIIPLKVSGAFHSPLLKEAGEKLYDLLKDINIESPAIPYVSNVNGRFIFDNSNIRELLSQQVYSPVKWQQSIENMIESGIDTFVEIGPGKTLSKFISKIDSSSKTINIDKVKDLVKLNL